MRRLYFDIDGTLVVDETGEAKAALVDGAFEAALIRARVDELVCIGNFVTAARMAQEVVPHYDGIGVIFDVCRGVFSDKSWFRSITSMAQDPANRAAEVDLKTDWWYIDDLAEHYFRTAGRMEVFQQNIGGRILVPSPRGDGRDVLNWLGRII